MRQLDYRGLAALSAVVSLGGFDKAAAALSISQPAVSHRIRTLETLSGTLLVIRSQPPRATETGQRLIAHYHQVQLLEAALHDPGDDEAALPRLAIAVNADSAATWLQNALTPFLAGASCVLDIRLDDQDHTLSLLREGHVFGCVTSSSEPVAGTTATPLGVMRYACVAAPGFAARWFAEGITARTVSRAPALVFDSKDALHERYLQRRLGRAAEFPRHAFASSEAFVRFLEAGCAYGMVPLLQAGAQLADGRLVDLTPEDGVDVPLTWYAWDIQTPLTRALGEHIVETARRWLQQ